MSLYGYARIGKAGLGNCLFSWARCEVFCHAHEARMLAPRWVQPKIGPTLRREKDKRFYVGLFNNRGYVRGVERAAALLTRRRVPEGALLDGKAPADGAVVEFTGMEGHFAPFMAERELVSRRLWEIVNPRLQRIVAEDPLDFEIGVHVRRGDKGTLKFGEPFSGQWHWAPADQWYVNCINHVRRLLGRPARVRIFSDARPEQIQALLALENVTLARDNPAIVDIFLLSKSKYFITTGTSSFSWWAVFLGRMPSVWYPALAVNGLSGRSGYEAETDLEGNVPGAFAEVLKAGQS